MNRFKKYLSSSISGIYWLVACEDEQSKDIPIPFSGEEGPGIHWDGESWSYVEVWRKDDDNDIILCRLSFGASQAC